MNAGPIVRTSGRIQRDFSFLGKDYVVWRQDPSSDKIARSDNKWKAIRNPYEKILARRNAPRI